MTPASSSLAAWALLALGALVLVAGLAAPTVRNRWREAVGRCGWWWPVPRVAVAWRFRWWFSVRNFWRDHVHE